jgi:hypothetical protein
LIPVLANGCHSQPALENVRSIHPSHPAGPTQPVLFPLEIKPAILANQWYFLGEPGSCDF